MSEWKRTKKKCKERMSTSFRKWDFEENETDQEDNTDRQTENIFIS